MNLIRAGTEDAPLLVNFDFLQDAGLDEMVAAAYRGSHNELDQVVPGARD